MKWIIVVLFSTGCVAGSRVQLAIDTLDCDGNDVVAGATQLRLTAKSGTSVVLSRSFPIRELPGALELVPNADVVLQVDALDAEGHWIARGISSHFGVPATDPVAVKLYRVNAFQKQCTSLVTPRAFHTATLLPDGRMLVVGGEGGTRDFLSSMELVSSTDARDLGPLAIPSSTGPVSLPRGRHTASLTDSGQVVIAGGETTLGALSSVVVVDPSADFAAGAVGPSSPSARSRHAALRWNDTLFFVGGTTGSLSSFDKYPPNTQVESLSLSTFRIETELSLPQARAGAAAGLVNEVAILAGGVNSGSQGSATVDFISLETPGILGTVELAEARIGASLVTIGNRALIAGGNTAAGGLLATTEWITPNPAGVEPGPTLAPRGSLCALPLSGGRALFVGGSFIPQVLNADETVENFAFGGKAFVGQSCTLAEDGSALVIGGYDRNGQAVGEIWRFTPSE